MLYTLLCQVLLDSSALLFRKVHSLERVFANSLDKVARLRLLIGRRVFNLTVSRCITHVHLLRIVLILLDAVYNQVHNIRAILLVLLYLDVIIRAGKFSSIVGCDKFNIGKKLLFTILRHLLVADSEAKLLLIRLLGLLF